MAEIKSKRKNIKVKEYYKNKKTIFREKGRNKCRELSNKKINKKRI